MAPTANARYLVLSDMHLGRPESSIDDPRANEALVTYMAKRAPYEEKASLRGEQLSMK